MALRSPSDSGSSSPLSSLASRSPSPPAQTYPSPSSSQDFPTNLSPSSDGLGADKAPAAKKRKVPERKPRTTEYLDLRSQRPAGHPQRQPHDLSASERTQLDGLLKVLHKKRKIVVVAGAGISVSAGIPDFRSSTGLFSTLRSQHKLKASGKHLFDASVYKSDESTTSFHEMVRSLSHLVTATQPTPFHHLLATLAQEGRLLRLYSQNVDGIDASLPPLATQVPLPPRAPWPRTIQLHGGLGKMVCQKCRHLSDFDPSLFDGPDPPSCPECIQLDSVRTTIAGKRSHGIGKLRPRIVLYNEYNPDEEAIGAVCGADLKNRPDAIIVVGTSLKVPGVRRIVKEMCGVVRSRRDGVAIWINNGPEPLGQDFKKCWDIVVRGDADEVARLANLGRWDEDETGEYQDLTASAGTKRKGSEVEVLVENTKRIKGAAKMVQGVLTPVGSPHLLKQELDADKLGLAKASTPTGETTTKKKRSNTSLLEDLKAAARQHSKTKAAQPAKKKAASKKPGPLKPGAVTAKISNTFKVSKTATSKVSKTATSKASTAKLSAKETTQDLKIVNQFPNLGMFQTGMKPKIIEIGPATPSSQSELAGASPVGSKAPSTENVLIRAPEIKDTLVKVDAEATQAQEEKEEYQSPKNSLPPTLAIIMN